MFTQIKILTRLELCNFAGFNVTRYTKNEKQKKKACLMFLLGVFLVAMLFFYIGAYTYGLIYLGLSDVVFAYLILFTSLFILLFGMLKSGSVLFKKEGYESICAMPLSKTAIVVSRFLKMYVTDAAFTLAIMLPGTAVYAWMKKPGALFYVLVVVGAFFVPLIPMAIATFLGAFVTAISSRMKHKSLVSAALFLLLCVLFLLASTQASHLEGELDTSMLVNLSDQVMAVLEMVYPPAVWFGTAIVTGDILKWLLNIVLFLAVAAVVVAVVSVGFQSICRGLYATTAKHNYKMQKQQESALLAALCRREFKRYFASSIYVVNTIIGPVMGTILCAVLFFVGDDFIVNQMPIQIDVGGLMPFLMAATFALMPTTATSISMEGKNWWIVNSLPLSTKNIIDAKILMNLILVFPFYLVSEVLLTLAVKPSPIELLWQMIVPVILILFFAVCGITVNLYLPVFDWEDETSVVKQSASSMISCFGVMAVSILMIVGMIVIPAQYVILAKAVICAATLLGTIVLYRKITKFYMDLT